MNIATISDLRAPAKRRLPSFVFDYLDGGAGTEAGMQRNTSAFDEIRLKPRMLVNIEERARFAPQNAWFQLYVSRFDEITDDIVDRTDRAGYEALVVTVDIPLSARRPR